MLVNFGGDGAPYSMKVFTWQGVKMSNEYKDDDDASSDGHNAVY